MKEKQTEEQQDRAEFALFDLVSALEFAIDCHEGSKAFGPLIAARQFVRIAVDADKGKKEKTTN